MTGTLAAGLKFDDFAEGMTWVTPAHTVTTGDVFAFNSFTGLTQRNSENGDLVLDELGALSIATGLAWVRLGINEGTAIAVLGAENWKFCNDVVVGDTIHVRQVVSELRPSASKLDRGIVKFDFEVLNHEKKLCQQGEWVFLWSRKEP